MSVVQKGSRSARTGRNWGINQGLNCRRGPNLFNTAQIQVIWKIGLY